MVMLVESLRVLLNLLVVVVLVDVVLVLVDVVDVVVVLVVLVDVVVLLLPEGCREFSTHHIPFLCRGLREPLTATVENCPPHVCDSRRDAGGGVDQVVQRNVRAFVLHCGLRAGEAVTPPRLIPSRAWSGSARQSRSISLQNLCSDVVTAETLYLKLTRAEHRSASTTRMASPVGLRRKKTYGGSS